MDGGGDRRWLDENDEVWQFQQFSDESDDDTIATKRSRDHPLSSHVPSIRTYKRFQTPTNNVNNSCLSFAFAPGLSEPASNFVFSPLLIRAALSLAAAGAQGDTLKQLLSFLGSSTVSHLNSAAAGTWGDFVGAPAAGCSGGALLSFVNGIWVDKSTPLKPSFQKTATSVYKAVVESVDFQKKASRVERDVNAWVEKSTNGLIKDLIPHGTTDESTVIVLANALYFKGNWARGFDKSRTQNQDFFLLDGNAVQVPFMTNRNGQFLEYFHGFKVLRLPYLDDKQGRKQQLRLSMLLYLPGERDGLNKLVRQATSNASFFDEYCPSEKVEVSKLKVPKFKICSTFEASEWLKGFGLELPFSKEKANFTEMAVVNNNKLGKLCFKEVVHKASIQVDEEGSIASAATWMRGSCMLASSIPPPPTFELEFVADHPFMFAIRQDDTGAVLFLGHVLDPSSPTI